MRMQGYRAEDGWREGRGEWRVYVCVCVCVCMWLGGKVEVK